MKFVATFRKLLFSLVCLSVISIGFGQTNPTPDVLWGKLFEEVQLKRIFPDNKTFVDAVPLKEPSVILALYNKKHSDSTFDLKKFVEENFKLPVVPTVKVTEGLPLKQHLEELWDALIRKADKKQAYSSLLPLPESYIVPGGRFREVYYWDSYFTIQGLMVSKRYNIVSNILDNFKWLIDNYQHIPNGNRNYYLSRSQPPFYALMVNTLAEQEGSGTYKKYYSAMEKEYNWWMQGERTIKPGEAVNHLVRLPDGSLLNRYHDQKNIPRQESYVQDVTTSKEYKGNDGQVFNHLRSAAESGWDFSSRWFGDTLHLNTIETGNIIPVDLNCLLYSYEIILAKAARAKGLEKKAVDYDLRAKKRREAILKYCWNKELKFFFDYNYKEGHTTNIWSAAGIMPLFTNVATDSQANLIQQQIKSKFLKDGGIVTTLYHTGQQWDAPNGWAPLQWIAVKGLMNYHYDALARDISDRWMSVNERVFSRTGKMLEKYNVENIHLESGGGEYPTQDGFGWSNGIYLKLYDLFQQKTKDSTRKAF